MPIFSTTPPARLLTGWFTTLVLGLALGAPAPALAQVPAWQQALSGGPHQPRIGGSVTRATAVDADGNVVVVGTFTGQAAFGNTLLTSSGSNDIFVAKWSPGPGVWLWARRDGGFGDDYANAVAVSGPNIYVSGRFEGVATVAGTALTCQGPTDIFVAKYTDTGATLADGWAERGGGFDNDVATGVAVSGTSVYISAFSRGPGTVAGVQLAGTSALSMVVAKYTDQGSSAANGWAVRGGGAGGALGYGIAARGTTVYVVGEFTGSGSVIAGTTLTGASTSQPDAFVAKYVDQGPTAAGGGAVRGGGTAADYAFGVATSGSSVYVTGRFDGTGPAVFAGTTLTNTAAGFSDMFLAKYTDTGTALTNGWAVQSQGSRDEEGNAVAVSGNQVYVTGSFGSNAGTIIAGTALAGTVGADPTTSDAFVAHYTDTGTTATNNWATWAGGSGDDSGYAVAATTTAVYSALGSGNTSDNFGAGTERAPAGNAIVGQQNAANGGWQQLDWALQRVGVSRTVASATDASGNVYVTGTFTGTTAFGATQLLSEGANDVFLAKWSPTANAWAWAVRAGGAGTDEATAVAVRGSSVYITGTYQGSSPATFAGVPLVGGASPAGFVAKYTDQGSSAANGWAQGFLLASVNGVAVQGANVYLAGSFTGATLAIAGATLTNQGGTDGFVAKLVDAGAAATPGWAAPVGGTGGDAAYGVAANGSSVYLTGYFSSSSGATVAGTALVGAGGFEMFVAKYLDQGGSVANGWAVSGGGASTDVGNKVAVQGSAVYVAGRFTTAPNVQIAGTTLGGSGLADAYLAKYTDTGATATNGWVVRSTGVGNEAFFDVVVSGSSLYVAGYFEYTATVAGTSLYTQTNTDALLAHYTDNGATATGQWATQGGGTAYDYGNAVAVSGGAVYLAGAVGATASFGPITLANNTAGNLHFLARVGGPGPTLLTVAPGTAAPGTTLTLTGTNLTGTTTVTFAGPTGPLVVSSGLVVNAAGTQLTVTVPAGAGTGPVSVVTPVGVSNSLALTVAAAPTIASLAPATGVAGSPVTLTGTNFTGATSLTLNGVAIAGFTVVSGTTITFVVPAGATSGPVAVTTPGGTATSAGPFTVTAPQLAVSQNNINYANGGIAFSFGTQVVGVTSAPVSFTLANAGTAPLPITSIGTTGEFALSGPAPTTVAAGGTAAVGVTITPTAPGIRTGTLVIMSGLGTYTVNLLGIGQAPAAAPVISGLSLSGAPVGTIITITGTNLAGTSTLTLNGVAITGFTVVNGTTVTFVVPAGASSGPLVLTTPAGASTVSFCVQYQPTTTPASRCGAGSVTLTAGGAPTGGSYVWYTQATGGTAISGTTGASFATPSLAATTLYYVSISTGSGPTACEGPRTLVSATIDTAPTVSITPGGPVSICQRGSLLLTATGADTYLWSTGATTASIIVSAAGSYTVTGTTTAGCVAASAATVVTVEPLPARPVITQGAAGTLSSSAATGNQWYLGGVAIPGATGATYVVASPAGNGNYTVVTTTATGCASPPSAAVAVVISGTTRSSLLAGLQVLPNPAHDHATVLLPRLPGATATLELVDALGRVVLTQPVLAPATGQQALRLTGLAVGIYALRLTVDGTTATRRLVVE